LRREYPLSNQKSMAFVVGLRVQMKMEHYTRWQVGIITSLGPPVKVRFVGAATQDEGLVWDNVQHFQPNKAPNKSAQTAHTMLKKKLPTSNAKNIFKNVEILKKISISKNQPSSPFQRIQPSWKVTEEKLKHVKEIKLLRQQNLRQEEQIGILLKRNKELVQQCNDFKYQRQVEYMRFCSNYDQQHTKYESKIDYLQQRITSLETARVIHPTVCKGDEDTHAVALLTKDNGKISTDQIVNEINSTDYVRNI